jgi:hypothetical protein
MTSHTLPPVLSTMSPALALSRVREWFLLEETERTLRLRTLEQCVLVRAHYDAALSRLRAGRLATEAVPAALLLRASLIHLLWAKQASHDPQVDDGALVRRDPTSSITDLPPDPEHQRVPSDADLVRASVSSSHPLYFDRLSPELAQRTRIALERAASCLRREVDPRSIANVRGTRCGRLAALALICLYAIYRVLTTALLPGNVARDKPVHLSSFVANSPDGHELVDGDTTGTYGVQTNTEESPHAIIDLLHTYKITKVRVYNRGDGWFDECLPLVVEVSVDGEHYSPIGRRETHFDQDPPWTIDARKQPARYVRLRVDRRGYLALTEVEVFAKN